MFMYSLLMVAALVLGSPYWLYRMAVSGRYRAGLGERLGQVPARLLAAAKGRPVVWVHAVSVGEVLAAVRLITELETSLPQFAVVLSTTTKTAQELAAKRLGEERVFYFPLDFAFSVRRYLDALRPQMLILMESELWPRVLTECAARSVPVAVVNARISDRSLPRYRMLRRLWRPLLAKVTLFLAQDEENARRLQEVGAPEGRVLVTGNLKYDVAAPKQSCIAELIHEAAAGRPIVVAGSTVDIPNSSQSSEDQLVIQGWWNSVRTEMGALLVIAPRHPQLFPVVYSVAIEFPTLLATEMLAGKQAADGYSVKLRTGERANVQIIVLDTIGDLASVYGIADVAFVGGSLLPRGGHNPLEPARFGVPVIMGPFFENFRDIVAKMQEADGLRIVQNNEELETAFIDLLTHREEAQAMGERGRAVFAAQAGATTRTVHALLALVKGTT